MTYSAMPYSVPLCVRLGTRYWRYTAEGPWPLLSGSVSSSTQISLIDSVRYMIMIFSQDRNPHLGFIKSGNYKYFSFQGYVYYVKSVQ